MKFFVLMILLIACCAKGSHLIAQHIVLYEAPDHYQLYPRDVNDFYKVVFCGIISGFDFDNVILNHKTAQRIAMIYSFFAICKAQEVNPYEECDGQDRGRAGN